MMTTELLDGFLVVAVVTLFSCVLFPALVWLLTTYAPHSHSPSSEQ